MGFGQSKGLTSYYDIQPKEIVFTDDENDSDFEDDLPHDLEQMELIMSQAFSKVHGSCTSIWAL